MKSFLGWDKGINGSKEMGTSSQCRLSFYFRNPPFMAGA
jgi:hypothetical protein